jgi:glycerophosphoryl diester phosphodiesterase
MPATTVAPGFLLPAGFDLEGHRGARGLEPENTLPAFETALDLGVTTLELDLHFSADGEVVIWHDAVIDPAKCRLADDAPDGLPDPDDPAMTDDQLAVRSLTVEELGGYRCDRNPDTDRFPDQDPVPTALAGDDYRIVPLGELFDLVDRYAGSDDKTEDQRAGAAAVQFNIETKRDLRDPDAIGDGFDGETVGPFEQRLLAVVAEHGLGDRVIIQSFDVRSLAALDAADPDMRLSVLTSSGGFTVPVFAVDRAIVWSPKSSTVDAGSVTAAHEAGHTVVPWTVDDLDEAARLVEIGVDGLITDRPDLFTTR